MKLATDSSVGRQVADAARWYDDQVSGRGDEFIAAIDDAFATILAHPLAWPVWEGIGQTSPPVRRFVLARFPFAIGFQVFPDVVDVVVVAHTSRRPGYWR